MVELFLLEEILDVLVLALADGLEPVGLLLKV